MDGGWPSESEECAVFQVGHGFLGSSLPVCLEFRKAGHDWIRD
jgi:hypothetical protein